MTKMLSLFALVPLLLAACGQSPTPVPTSATASAPTNPVSPGLTPLRLYCPETPVQTDPGSGSDTAICPDSPPEPPAAGPAAPDLRLAYIKTVAWGSVAQYDAQYASFAGTSGPFPDLNWERDGCSTQGFGLGYTEDFRAACNVHDFGYRNLSKWERTDANRKTTDQNFHRNMQAICAAKSWLKRPPCYVVAQAYYDAVRLAGSSKFSP